MRACSSLLIILVMTFNIYKNYKIQAHVIYCIVQFFGGGKLLVNPCLFALFLYVTRHCQNLDGKPPVICQGLPLP